SLFELSNWPSADAGGMSASSWRASRTCGTAWAKALGGDIPRSRALPDWRCNMVASSSAMSQSTVSSIIVRPRRITGISCCHTAKRREGDSRGNFIKQRRSIVERPAEVEGRGTPGHWEADFMLFAKCGQELLFLHARQTPLNIV